MDGTRGKSIFDIPKPLAAPAPTAEEAPKPKRRRRKRKKPTKKPKTARAGGVEVSQKTNARGKKQITLKHKGGLTQEITIHTGDSKPRGHKAKGQQVSWNMKPAKFKASRGLRDDRVYLQPPKREYFGNRYKSAIDKIKIDQKVKEAGASKNKEIADVRDTARREREAIQQRERSKDDTITELKKANAGIVASHNVAVRNQSRATILGGDVGELNKLYNRRGIQPIEQLISTGEISDNSTILQLDIPGREMDRLVRLRQQEQSDYITGKTYVFTTPKGLVKQGKLIEETAKFVRLRKPDGGVWRVSKNSLITGEELRKVRSESADPAVVSGAALPQTYGGASPFGSPRTRTASEEREIPEWTKTAGRRDRRKPRKTSGYTTLDEFVEAAQQRGILSEAQIQHYTQALPRSAKPTPSTAAEPEPSGFSGREELSSTTDDEPEVAEQQPLTLELEGEGESSGDDPTGARAEFLAGGESGGGTVRTAASLEEALQTAERASPEGGGLTIDQQLAEGTPREFFENLVATASDRGRRGRSLTPEGISAEAVAAFRASRPQRLAAAQALSDIEESGATQQPQRLRESTPPTAFLTARQTKDLGLGGGGISVVDNRNDRKRRSGGSVSRPVKVYSMDDFTRVVKSRYGEKTAGRRIIDKTKREGTISTNDSQILSALGFGD